MDGWRHDTDKPTWDGSPLNGKRILLFSEQGLGDTIHFGRYATLVARRGGRVILEVQKGLQDVVRTIPGVERVVVRGDPVGEFDTLAPLLSLPGIFRTSLQAIPATVPYIKVNPVKNRAMAAGSSAMECRESGKSASPGWEANSS